MRTTHPWPLGRLVSTACPYFDLEFFSLVVTWAFDKELRCRQSFPGSLVGCCTRKRSPMSRYSDWHDSQSMFSWSLEVFYSNVTGSRSSSSPSVQTKEWILAVFSQTVVAIFVELLFFWKYSGASGVLLHLQGGTPQRHTSPGIGTT